MISRRPATAKCRNAAAERARGFSMIEVLVGVAIGIVSLLVIYQVFAVSEAYKRTTTAGADSQSTGMVASYLLGQEINAAGSTMASSWNALDDCPAAATFAASWRPIPVVIEDGGPAAASDSISVAFGVAPIRVTPVAVRSNTPPGSDFEIQSPTSTVAPPQRGGFAVNDLFVVARTGVCETARVTAITPVALGVVRLAHTPVINTYGTTAKIVNLGPDPNAGVPIQNPVRKLAYTVDAATGTLRRQDLVTAGAVANPIASNVVLLKAQYGVDTNNDQVVDLWTSATGEWDHVAMRNVKRWNDQGGVLGVRRVIAIRTALVVRAAQNERSFDAEGTKWAAHLDAPFSTTLFDCHGRVPCTGEIPLALPGSANFRYRVFEQTYPLRSVMWAI